MVMPVPRDDRPSLNDSSAWESESSEGYSSGGSTQDDQAQDESSRTLGSTSVGSVEGVNAKLVKREAKTLSILRILVITSLLTLAAIVSNITFLLVLHEEESKFEKRLNHYAQDILKNFLQEVEKTYWMADSLSGDITAFANDAGTNFPYVSLPDFGQRCQDARRVAIASTIWFAPLVENYERAAWEIYASHTFSTLVDESFVDTYDPHQVAYRDTGRSVDQGIFKIRDGSAVTDDTSYFFPIWQISTSNETAGSTSTIMFNQYSEMARRRALSKMVSEGGAMMTEALLTKTSESVHALYDSPTSSLYFPVFNTLEQKTISGALTIEVDWESFFQKALHGVEEPVVVVLENSCGQIYSFEVTEQHVMYLGEGDMHDDKIEGHSPNTTFKSFEDVQYFVVDKHITPLDEEFDITNQELQHENEFVPSGSVCSYRIFVYPTVQLRDRFLTNKPTLFQAGIAMIFLFTTAIFIVYECLVESRQKKNVASAKEAKAVVNSLFPKNVRKRLYEEAKKKGEINAKSAMASMQTPKSRVKKFLKEGAGDLLTSEPIADLFPNATVMFADISGFTAWSSEREPSQVFKLLETIYGAMDTAARKLGVFKVETVGDTYVAATGLPEQREDHAVVMARFARTCLVVVKELTRGMESSLGPGTADLEMRFGMHSGPVTAGVLRGEKSRFQLFGDTMNTAARMESTGVPGKIQMSNDTAKYIIDSGKSHWLMPRKEVVEAKGKGEMSTFWLKIYSKTSRRASTRTLEQYDSDSDDDGNEEAIVAESRMQFDRLVDWNVEIMLSILKRIVARRQDMMSAQDIVRRRYSKTGMDVMNVGGGYLLDEVKEVVNLPAFDPMLPGHTTEAAAFELPRVVKNELRDYVSQIAAGYNSNPFHNLEHASHVCLSANKLLKRIVESNDVDYRLNSNEQEASTIRAVAADLHKHTYGISSDPLTHFATVFSALIHDVGHTGVPNSQLAMEHPEVALKYRNQAIAEQRSVDISWELLSAPCYSNLRSAIFSNPQERIQFRELVVNSVLATDIFDKQMTAVRKSRWNKAFYGEALESSPEEDMNRKATIVIEHIIQASDVAHTMQHWHIYIRWNERLFTEMYRAFESGRSDKDPAEGWYKGELWFFDNYVIPLAKKLEDCGVFGVSSDEYLNYAMDNRKEWERKGQDVVAAMVARCASKKS